jgi:hypothetical protein
MLLFNTFILNRHLNAYHMHGFIYSSNAFMVIYGQFHHVHCNIYLLNTVLKCTDEYSVGV